MSALARAGTAHGHTVFVYPEYCTLSGLLEAWAWLGGPFTGNPHRLMGQGVTEEEAAVAMLDGYLPLLGGLE